eukprot:TRINITY_DN2337_c0_g1_i2.p1 TRINITY_DN2337_c0_g1~~TRINITY_DN2337_c0_g1_i2.p1  ORF type:complete len:167 (-),score=36.32 TRINITY_DN2337_c0_g1_i2:77-577(-)
MDRAIEKGILIEKPDQLIINNYEPGQGIAKHVDKMNQFKEHIVSISLLSDCLMIFREKETQKAISVRLSRRSAIGMSGDARSKWTHEIPSHKKFEWKGMKVPRNRRISLTFRNIIIKSDTKKTTTTTKKRTASTSPSATTKTSKKRKASESDVDVHPEPEKKKKKN